MTRFILLLIVLLLCIGCYGETKSEKVAKQKYSLNCTRVNPNILRCEGGEAICYIYDFFNGGAISCFKKEVSK